jgi:hypothetical protein
MALLSTGVSAKREIPLGYEGQGQIRQLLHPSFRDNNFFES